MEIIIIGVIAIAISVIGICLAVRPNNKNKKLDEETRKFNNDKVVDELVNENSELYKLIKEYVHISVVSVGPNKFANIVFGNFSIHIFNCFTGITSPANNTFVKYCNSVISSVPILATIHSADGTQ